MRYIHSGCGGEVDTRKRMCLRCKKKWNPVSFMLTTGEIRPMVDKKGRLVEGPTKKELRHAKPYAKWADKVPGAGWFAGKLPEWPRWARILVTLAFIGVVVLVVHLAGR